MYILDVKLIYYIYFMSHYNLLHVTGKVMIYMSIAGAELHITRMGPKTKIMHFFIYVISQMMTSLYFQLVSIPSNSFHNSLFPLGKHV